MVNDKKIVTKRFRVTEKESRDIDKLVKKNGFDSFSAFILWLIRNYRRGGA